jgi:hypothetical protein
MKSEGEAALGYGAILTFVLPLNASLYLLWIIFWNEKLIEKYHSLSRKKIFAISLLIHLCSFGVPLLVVLYGLRVILKT